jgi:hypothetical protein
VGEVGGCVVSPVNGFAQQADGRSPLSPGSVSRLSRVASRWQTSRRGLAFRLAKRWRGAGSTSRHSAFDIALAMLRLRTYPLTWQVDQHGDCCRLTPNGFATRRGCATSETARARLSASDSRASIAPGSVSRLSGVAPRCIVWAFDPARWNARAAVTRRGARRSALRRARRARRPRLAATETS